MRPVFDAATAMVSTDPPHPATRGGRASRTRSVTTHWYHDSPPIQDKSEPSQSLHSWATHSLWNTRPKANSRPSLEHFHLGPVDLPAIAQGYDLVVVPLARSGGTRSAQTTRSSSPSTLQFCCSSLGTATMTFAIALSLLRAS